MTARGRSHAKPLFLLGAVRGFSLVDCEPSAESTDRSEDEAEARES